MQLEAIPSTSKDNSDLQRLTSKLDEIKQQAQLLLTEVTQQGNPPTTPMGRLRPACRDNVSRPFMSKTVC